MGPKRKREENKKQLEIKNEIDEIEEAIEEGINLDDEVISESEGSGEDLMENAEK